MVDRYVPASELPIWAAWRNRRNGVNATTQEFKPISKEKYATLSDAEKQSYAERERAHLKKVLS